MKVRELKPGQSARIEAVGGKGELRQHLLDMGVIPGAEITVIKLAPMGDPMDAEAPILWLPDVTSWLTGKDPVAGKD